MSHVYILVLRKLSSALFIKCSDTTCVTSSTLLTCQRTSTIPAAIVYFITTPLHTCHVPTSFKFFNRNHCSIPKQMTPFLATTVVAAEILHAIDSISVASVVDSHFHLRSNCSCACSNSLNIHPPNPYADATFAPIYRPANDFFQSIFLK